MTRLQQALLAVRFPVAAAEREPLRQLARSVAQGRQERREEQVFAGAEAAASPAGTEEAASEGG